MKPKVPPRLVKNRGPAPEISTGADKAKSRRHHKKGDPVATIIVEIKWKTEIH